MSQRRVWIAQLLCPERHCILAAVGEYDTAEEAEGLRPDLEKMFEGLLASRSIKPICALCGSAHFHIEIARTTFRTMAEAKPAL